MEAPKLFRVEKTLLPEWGRSEVLFTKYFLANSRETLESVVRDRYGPARKWFDYDRCEEVIVIEECECETL